MSPKDDELVGGLHRIHGERVESCSPSKSACLNRKWHLLETEANDAGLGRPFGRDQRWGQDQVNKIGGWVTGGCFYRASVLCLPTELVEVCGLTKLINLLFLKRAHAFSLKHLSELSGLQKNSIDPSRWLTTTTK
jgi:hypothetical protein